MTIQEFCNWCIHHPAQQLLWSDDYLAAHSAREILVMLDTLGVTVERATPELLAAIHATIDWRARTIEDPVAWREVKSFMEAHWGEHLT